MDVEEFDKELQKRGTQVIGADMCMCADCVARRKKHGVMPMKVIPEESDDPIQEANRKMALKRITSAMRRTKQTQRKRKQRKKKKEE